MNTQLFSGKALSEVDVQLQAAISNHWVPSAVYGVYFQGYRFFGAFGQRRIEIDGWSSLPASLETIYDLASLTKPLATAALVGRYVDRGWISFSDTVLPDVTVFDLLSHQTGLQAWEPFYIKVRETGSWAERRELFKNLLSSQLNIPARPKRTTLYSDLNYMVLGHWIENLVGKPLEQLFTADVSLVLGLENSLHFRKLTSWVNEAPLESYAATEVCPYRGLLQGRVHDDNCFSIGGVSGHAGLFGDVKSVLSLTENFLPARSFFSPKTLKVLTDPAASVSDPGILSTRTAGFDLKTLGEAGLLPEKGFSSRTFGHLGFTGTSVYVDPVQSLVAVLLTNRVHPSRLASAGIKNVRKSFHQALVSDLFLA